MVLEFCTFLFDSLGRATDAMIDSVRGVILSNGVFDVALLIALALTPRIVGQAVGLWHRALVAMQAELSRSSGSRAR